jgi:two-component system sensor histidine kinase CiaH
MITFKKKRHLIITILYWFLLLYIVAALVFWFLELQKLNTRMINYKINELKLDDPYFNSKLQALNSEKQRKNAQFIGEGIVFFAVIIFGAVFMYRAVRRQFTLQRQQENLMMAITHELKTPIAITKLNLETLQKHQLDEQKRQKLLHMTLQETERLNALASNILISAQLEAGRSFSKEDINFSDLVRSSVNDFTNRFPDRKWTVSISDEAEITGDPLLLQILVNNLLENAVKYSPSGTPVKCKINEENGHILLSIADEGPGIPASEKKMVFRKFYRIGSEQTRSAKGTGLGLYLCKKIAHDHDATIRIEDNTPHGCIFLVRFEKKFSD